MMSLLVTFAVIALVVLLMSVGVLFGRKPVQGSCGGMNKISDLGECEICGGEPLKCEQGKP
jgi:hypothetical protein